MRIEEEYKKSGFFWLPGKEENKIPGILSINNGGDIELEIVGHFDDGVGSLNDDHDLTRIVGHVEKDGFVTLENCFYTRKNISFGGISKSKILANTALVGAAWNKDESLTFNTFSFSVDCLDEWVGISGIKSQQDSKSKTAIINYKLPETISFSLSDEMRLEICFACTLPTPSSIVEAKIIQQVFFKIVSEELCELDDFVTVAFKITSLMCFAMDEIVTIKNVKATTPNIQRDGGNDKKYPIPISIYYRSIPFSEKKPKKNRHDMLFNFGVISTNAQQVFQNWLNAYEILSPAFSLYFTTKAGAQKYLDGKFLALAQGLETYHRRTSNETLMETSSFEVLIAEILGNCPEEHMDWLKGRLMYGNEINLRRRIKNIVEPFKKHLGTNSERSKLLRKIVDTRNYLTHYNASLKDNAAAGKELWILCMKMEAIFNLHFLKVIGFNEQEIDNVVVNCYLLKRKLEEPLQAHTE